MTMMLIDSENFHRRCASALTHPVTLAALVALLLNDGLFKSLWPDSWVTGKLSDLAWVVFASPLLAFVLSLFLSRRLFGRRTAVLVSYVGLPALYAAFNTFEPVHDRILWGLSLVAGGTAGSPLDPSDSLVIPFGLGIAVWVLRRRPAGRDRLRVRLALLAAGVATFATVATDHPGADFGLRNVGIASDGTVVAAARTHGRSFHHRSNDGGLSWTPDNRRADKIAWGGSKVGTPLGMYMIKGSRIVVVTADNRREIVYTAAYLQNDANVWMQKNTTTNLGDRELGTEPYSVVYDERSGNVIVAMGLQGVLVGTPDGQWSRVAVGRHSPTDFSPSSKALQLLSSTSVWVTTICISLSMTLLSVVLSRYRRETFPSKITVTLAILAMFTGLPSLLVLLEMSDELIMLLILAILSSPLLILAAIAFGIYGARMPKHSPTGNDFALAMSIVSVIASFAVLLSFGESDFDFWSRLLLPLVIFPILAFLFAIAALTVAWRQLVHWQAVLTTFAGMNILTVLVLLMWIQLGFGLPFAKVSALALVALAGLALVKHLRRIQEPL